MKYSLILKEIPRAKPKGFLKAQAIFHRVSRLGSKYRYSQLNSSNVLPWRAIFEQLILLFALAAGAKFSSILPALLGVYWKIYPQLHWEYIFQYTPSRAGPIWENITQWIEQYWTVEFQ